MSQLRELWSGRHGDCPITSGHSHPVAKTPVTAAGRAEVEALQRCPDPTAHDAYEAPEVEALRVAVDWWSTTFGPESVTRFGPDRFFEARNLVNSLALPEASHAR